ncbi:MAG: hypothetical protein OJF49_003576 [Ktedonobacterales bacterium]|jgi:RNA polymerase sigma-70 factor (ECF subfamily)|nr:MAG: hypothetical protein OJF49_003576 [Ktedonobacterales bacterium]
MTTATITTTADLVTALAGERTRLVRLCAILTRDPHAAEDLAQETLIEAWRSLARLRDPSGLAPWLNVIARNVCLRWQRSRSRDAAHHVMPSGERETPSAPALADVVADDADIEINLERAELADLLDRALGLLPAETRHLLVASYVQELPAAEIAARLGMSEGAVRVRLHRGKLALRHALTTDLRPEAATFGIVAAADADALDAMDEPRWQQTRIWCPFCGAHYLMCRIDREKGEFSYRCAGECMRNGGIIGRARNPVLLAGLTSAKSILTRQLLTLDTHYRHLMTVGTSTCSGCGQRLPMRRWTPESAASDLIPPPSPLYLHGIYHGCLRCEWGDSATPWHLALDTAPAQRFWRRHPRMRALTTRLLEFDGRPALHTGFQSTDGAARLDLISARDTHEVLYASDAG